MPNNSLFLTVWHASCSKSKLLLSARLRQFGVVLVMAFLPCFAAAQSMTLATEPLLTRSAPVKPNFLFILDDSGSMGGAQVYGRHVVLASGTCANGDPANLSPANNFLHYNPAKRYAPARNNVGDPGTTAALTTTTVVTYIPKASFNPAASTSLVDICNPNKYDRIDVESNRWKLNTVTQTPNPFGAKNAKRTDCAGATCTLTEERQNIANWVNFHSTRISAAKTGVGEGFSKVPTNFRLSWTTINVANATAIPKIKDYDLSKTDFYSWLNGINPGPGTPLRQALNIAGQYYSNDTNIGPWANKPWLTGNNSEGEAKSSHLSCRRSFTMMITDGEWNGNAASTAAASADVDGVNGPEITHSNGTIKYQYVPGSKNGLNTPGSTDGFNTGKRDTTGNAGTFNDTLADVAMYYWNRDLRPDLLNNATGGGSNEAPFWQNMTTYTGAFGPVGFLTEPQIDSARGGTVSWTTTKPIANARNTIDDLIHAAHNGGGQFLTVSDAESFSDKLSSAIGVIADQQFSQAGVAASAVVLTAGTKKFVPRFNPISWWGNVEMINLDAKNGTEIRPAAWEVISTLNGKPTGASTFPTPINRKIYTFVTSTPAKNIIPFEYTGLLAQGLVASSATTNTSTLMNNSTTLDLINYLRGVRTKEGPNAADFRKREAILGDIVNSTPVFVKSASSYDYSTLPTGAAKTGWAAYDAAKKARTEGVLFVGANDGMLHGFREGVPSDSSIKGGEEVFAFIPRGVLGNLHLLANKQPFEHRFYVDGPLAQSDAYISVQGRTNGTYSTRWANVLMGSTGAGGRSVFAIDATYPVNMSERSVMWEVNSSLTSFANLGNVMNEVETGILDDGTWVAVFNNGPYGASGKASLFVVNLATGALIKEIGTNNQTGNGLSGIRLLRNQSGVIQGGYAGDIKGNMWKFTLQGLSSGWTSELLFTTNNGLGGTSTFQPISATPALIVRTDGITGTMVVFGTGKLFDNADQSNTDRQSGYGLFDNAPFGTPINTITSRLPLVAVTTVENTNTFGFGDTTNQTGATRLFNTTASRNYDWTTDRGWYIDYTIASGQRTIFPAEPLGNLVRLDTIVPRLNQQACETSASTGFNFLINPITGKCNDYAVLDTNKDGAFTDKDATSCIYSTDADGEDVALSKCEKESCEQCTGPDCDPCEKLFSIQDSLGQLAVCTDPCGDTRYVAANPGKCSKKQASSTYRRDWRQLFMRP